MQIKLVINFNGFQTRKNTKCLLYEHIHYTSIPIDPNAYYTCTMHKCIKSLNIELDEKNKKKIFI